MKVSCPNIAEMYMYAAMLMGHQIGEKSTHLPKQRPPVSKYLTDITSISHISRKEPKLNTDTNFFFFFVFQTGSQKLTR